MIGDLRVRLRLERPELSGGAVVFTDAGGAWAAMSAADDGARVAFDIRVRRDVRAGWRVLWGANGGERRFRVVAVVDADALGARLTLFCTEELQ